MDEKLQKLKELIDKSERIVFFGGAGVSTESGIPDFRSADGLYNRNYSVPPETILSYRYYLTHPETFYRFYREKMLVTDAKPNDAHRALAKLEAEGKLLAVITQNVDGLHQKAGSKTVYELHGSIWRNRCVRCMKAHPVEAVKNCDGVPLCECGGMIKPEVVLYQESLNEKTLKGAIRAIQNADLLIIGGTSLAVYPAAGLIDYFSGSALVIINRSPTPADREAALLIDRPIGEVLGKVCGIANE